MFFESISVFGYHTFYFRVVVSLIKRTSPSLYCYAYLTNKGILVLGSILLLLAYCYKSRLSSLEKGSLKRKGVKSLVSH